MCDLHLHSCADEFSALLRYDALYRSAVTDVSEGPSVFSFRVWVISDSWSTHTLRLETEITTETYALICQQTRGCVPEDFNVKLSNLRLSSCLIQAWEDQNTWNSLFTLRIYSFIFNLLKSTGHVMHQQFNIQQLYVLLTLYLCVLYLSENKQRLVPLTA